MKKIISQQQKYNKSNISDIEDPTVPANLATSNITDTTVDLTWTASTDNVAVSFYRVYNNDVLFLASTGNVTSYTLSGLSASTSYSLTVRAVDTSGNESNNSNIANFTTTVSGDITAPTTPTNLVTSNITENTIDLTWTASTDNVGVVNYAIYNNDVFVTNTGNVTSYTLTGLIAETNYLLTIRALDAVGNESANSNLQNVTTIASQFTSTRFLWLGDSYSYTSYFFPNQVESLINETYPNEVVESVMMASPGESIDSFTGSAPNIDTYMAQVTDTPEVDTYAVVWLGVNDARVKLYEDLTQPQIDTKIANLNYIIDAIEAKGFTPILLDAGWSPFEPTANFPANLGPAYIDESKGTLPYNDNIVKPVALARTPTFCFPDGTSWAQTYEVLYNSYPETASGDGLHPNGNGYTAVKNSIINTIMKFIFTGEAPTNRIVKAGANPPDEIAYFEAVEVTSADSANLQTLLDANGSIRLDSGDYSTGGNITIGSNQSLYGFPSQDGTEIGARTITVLAGSTNVIIKDFDAGGIIFQSGAEISNVLISNISKCTIEGTGFRLVDSKITNIHNVKLDFDNSLSGYARNNEIVRAFAQASPDHVLWLGNDTEPTYGNIELSRNFLTSTTDTSNYDNLQTHTLLGTDSENWGANGAGVTRGPYYFRNCGQVNIFNSFGFSSPSVVPEYDIEADLVWMQRTGVATSNQTPIFRTGTDVVYVEGNRTQPIYEGSNVYLQAYHSSEDVIFNGSNVLATITGADATALSNMIYKPVYTPISKPTFYLPDSPAGVDWATNRTGQADQSAFIQNLIDTNGVAELDAGIYYISQSLLVKNGEGIIGKGTGRTVIVAITDNFPIIKVDDTVTIAGESTNQNHILKYLTLQGGSIGYHVLPNNAAVERYMITNNTVNNVVFRNQVEAGIKIEQIFGYDNNFFDSVCFVDSANGILEIAQPLANVLNDQDIAYVDKTVFYNCQFINCTTALNMVGIRANNLNAWVNCLFDGNGVAFNVTQSNALYTANSIFRNHTGSEVIDGNARMSLYGCDFSNNSVTSLFGNRGTGMYVAECNFNDAVPIYSGGVNNQELYMWNTNSTSTIDNSNMQKCMLINNNIVGNAALSKPMVEITNGTALTILDGAVNVYPQLLVKQ